MPDEIDVRRGSLIAARIAVAALFFVNGAAYANFVPRIPDVKAALDLGEGALGLAIFGGAIGGLLGSLVAGPLDARLSSRTASLLGGLVLGGLLAGPGLARSWTVLTVALFLLTVSDSLMDVSMNAEAVAVQRGYGRSIVNGFHALWSIGAVAGSLTGSLAAARGVPVAAHLATTGVVVAVVAVAAHRWLPQPAAARTSAPAVRDAGQAIRWIERARRGGLVLPTGAVGALGLMTLVGAIVEDAPGSWSAVYLRETVGAPAGVAGLGFAAFAAAMTVGRLLGDRAVDRFGAAPVLRAGTLIGALGLGVALVLATPVAGIVGFGLLGIGVSTLFPLAFATAGDLADTAAGAAIGMVSLLARVGFLLAPLLVGAIADAVGLARALGVVVVASVTVAASAGVVTRRAARSG